MTEVAIPMANPDEQPLLYGLATRNAVRKPPRERSSSNSATYEDNPGLFAGYEDPLETLGLDPEITEAMRQEFLGRRDMSFQDLLNEPKYLTRGRRHPALITVLIDVNGLDHGRAPGWQEKHSVTCSQHDLLVRIARSFGLG